MPAFLNEVKVSFPILIDDQRILGGLYEVPNTPTNYVIDARGKIVFRNVGYEAGAEKTLGAEIEHALGAK